MAGARAVPEDKFIHAGGLLAEAWRSHALLAGLPPSARPTTLQEAHAIQDAMVAALGERVSGWKVGAVRPLRGAIFASRTFASPARIPAADHHLRIVEGEVAFVATDAMPPRSLEYTREEVAERVLACAAIEIVDSRYADFPSTPELERAADLLSNGGFVYATLTRGWTSLDLAKISVSLSLDGRVVLGREGGHVTGDPLGACVMLVNSLRETFGLRTGQFVTTGTYTGAMQVDAGISARVNFEGLGAAEVIFI